MTARSPHRPGTRPTTLQAPILLDGSPAGGRDGTAPQEAGGFEELLRQFEDAVRDDPAIDREMRDELREQFRQAAEQLGDGPVEIGIPDRSVWMDAVQSLHSSGAISEADANDLVRQINHALQPLERRESQLAIEFSRRLQTEGEEKALAWFRQQAAASGSSEQAAPAATRPNDVVTELRSEMIHSRSRRLRGPP